MFVQSSEDFEKKRELSEVWFFDWSFETKTAIFNFDIPAEKFSAEHGNCSFEVLKNLKKKENFQKFDFLFDLMRRRLQLSILISLPKPFLPSTVILRSKFWRIGKKRELSEVWFFDWSFETKTAIFNFDIPAEKLLAKHGECSFKILKSLKKIRTFRSCFFYSNCSFGQVECSFNKKVKIFLPRFKKRFSSSYVNSITNISKRIHKAK